MTNSTVTAPSVTIAGSQGPAEAEILTPKALEFLGALASNFEAERQRLLAARVTRAEALRNGKLYDFLPETASVRWTVLHLIEETARHAGHADIIRESLDGASAGALMAAAEGWPETNWVTPWTPAGASV